MKHDLEIPAFLRRKKETPSDGKAVVDTPLSNVPSTPGGVRGAAPRVLKDESAAKAAQPKVITRFKKPLPKGKASAVRSVKPTKADQRKAASKPKAKLVDSGKGTLTLVKPGLSKTELAARKSETQPKESASMKKSTTKKASTPKGELSGKSLLIWNLISRKGGATQKELCKATKWGQVSQSPLKPFCKRMGVKLHFEGRGEDRVYSVR
jgi:hypothetical protein